MGTTDSTVLDQWLREAGAEAGAEIFAHARDLRDGKEVGWRSDNPVVTASVFKVSVLLEYVRQVSSGELDPREQLEITDADRVLGPSGLSVFTDDTRWSLRDLATSMMTVSDNTATDVLVDILGLDRINKTLADLGLPGTVLVGACQGIFDAALVELGVSDFAQLDAAMESLGSDVAGMAFCDPARTNRSTPRESTELLARIWSDEAATPEACAEARRILGLQVWSHRLASGFPDDRIRVSGKTGTIGVARNEIGVVEYPDGSSYAIAVFLRTSRFAYRQPAADALIGRVARALVDHLQHA
ncbi:serine hydrolase [Nocardioides panacihumi]|uniref:Serine hydrolase n=1 Tax=Nocardioides panacihumi TaxID=400774 RepID=A0ABP5D801_9ACTN